MWLTAKEATRVAGEALEAAGFVVDGASNETMSLYYRRPGRISILRVSNHEMGRVNRSRHLMAAEIVMDERVVDFVEEEIDGETTDGEAITITETREIRHTGLLQSDIVDLVADAIAEYDATTDEEEE